MNIRNAERKESLNQRNQATLGAVPFKAIQTRHISTAMWLSPLKLLSNCLITDYAMPSAHILVRSTQLS